MLKQTRRVYTGGKYTDLLEIEPDHFEKFLPSEHNLFYSLEVCYLERTKCTEVSRRIAIYFVKVYKLVGPTARTRASVLFA